MCETTRRIEKFVAYAEKLKGDEKGEAQVFCERLFQAFGHEGNKEAGATLEERVKRTGRSTAFVDLMWRPRLLLEMKSKKEKLQRHYQQAFEYWLNATPNRPRYVVLCNFKEFWIYDFDFQLHEPVDRIDLKDLPARYTAFNFLFPDERRPQFDNDRVAVTRVAAAHVAQAFNSIVARGENRDRAQRFILQCVVAMFSEDFDLLPRGLFTELLTDCQNGQNSFDLLGNLFRQMNSQTRPRGGRFKKVKYFNGGLFQTVDPVELNQEELALLSKAAGERWSKVAPPVFGTLFQSSMDEDRRHAYGAHFTSEADIQKIVLPTIVRPWRERITATSTLKELLSLSEELLRVRVLDPACGSGNFLYIAYRELVNLEMEILAKIHELFGARARRAVGTASLLSAKQFYGLDKDAFAVELAKVTLMLGRRAAISELVDNWFPKREELPFEFEEPLPLDNLDNNIKEGDALFDDWPDVDYIIGNPPYQSKNKMQEEFGRAYLNKVRDKYPDVPGRADYCVYWLRRTQDELSPGKRAGLVGTNTIRQNYSREGGLDYIVENGGTIYEAVSSQVWSGDASVHVSIVNWIKGTFKGPKKLFTQVGDSVDSPWQVEILEHIPSTLSSKVDASKAPRLQANITSGACNQGQTHGHNKFVLNIIEAGHYLSSDRKNRDVIFPYLNTQAMLTSYPPCARSYVIDFSSRDVTEAARYGLPFERVKKYVLPPRKKAAESEKKRNDEARANNPRARINRHHERFLQRWWLLSYSREDLMGRLATIPRYIACGQLTKRPIFEFVSTTIHPNAQLIVFPLPDDYSFGVLQSAAHWLWFNLKGSTQTTRPRYTSDTVFDTFPWPQAPTTSQIKAVAKAAVAMRTKRREIMDRNRWSFRELYRTLDQPGEHPLRDSQNVLDEAVLEAYGFRTKDDVLRQLLSLCFELGGRETRGEAVVPPGLPATFKQPELVITADCIAPPQL